MTTHNLTYQECPYHSFQYIVRNMNPTDICGCPRTTRTEGLVVYKSDITGNWVVWDCSISEWVGLSGDWQTAMNQANDRIRCLSGREHDHEIGHGYLCIQPYI